MYQKTQMAMQEEWIDISYDQINIEMLRNMIEEFIAKVSSFLPEFLLEKKVEKILEFLKEGKAKIDFDLISGKANIFLVN